MEPLKFYLKDKKIFLFLSFLMTLSMVYIIVDLFLTEGQNVHVDAKSIVIVFLYFPFAITAIVVFLFKYIRVYVDYKRKKTKTITVKIISLSPVNCTDKFKGWYLTFEGINTDGRKIKFWYYKKYLDYPTIHRNQFYDIVYYDFSKCIYMISKHKKEVGQNG